MSNDFVVVSIEERAAIQRRYAAMEQLLNEYAQANAAQAQRVMALVAENERLSEAARMALGALDIACQHYGEVGTPGTHWGDWDAAMTVLRAALGAGDE